MKAPGTGTPTGVVTFRVGNKTLGSATLANGEAVQHRRTDHRRAQDHGRLRRRGRLQVQFGDQRDECRSRIGPEFQVNTFTDRAQQQPSIAPLSNGGFVAAWRSEGQDDIGNGVAGKNGGIYAQRYATTGKPAGKEVRVNTTVAFDQSLPSVASLPGSFVVVWQSSLQQNVSGP